MAELIFDEDGEGRISDEYLDQLRKTYAGRLIAFGYRITRNEQAAEDIVMDALRKIINKTFTTERHIVNWLFKVVRNASINHVELVKKEKESEGYLKISESPPDPEAERIKVEVRSFVVKEINALPGETREVAKLSYLEGLKNSEIAERLCKTVYNVANLLVNAKKILSKKIKKDDLLS